MLNIPLTHENYTSFTKWSKKTLVNIEDVALGMSHVITHLGFEKAVEYRTLWSGQRFDVASRELGVRYIMAGCPNAKEYAQNGVLKSMGSGILVYDVENTAPDVIYDYFLKSLSNTSLYRYASRGAEQAEKVRPYVNVNEPLFQDIFFQEESLEDKIKRLIPTLITKNIQDSVFFDFIKIAKENPALTYSLFTKADILNILACAEKQSIMFISSNVGKLLQSVLYHRQDLCDAYYNACIQYGCAAQCAVVKHPRGYDFIKNAKFNVYSIDDYKLLFRIWGHDIEQFQDYSHVIQTPLKESFVLIDKLQPYNILQPKHIYYEIPNLFIMSLMLNKDNRDKLRGVCCDTKIHESLDFLDKIVLNKDVHENIIKRFQSAIGVKRKNKIHAMDPVQLLLTKESFFNASFDELQRIQKEYKENKNIYHRSLYLETFIPKNRADLLPSLELYVSLGGPVKQEVEEMELLF